MKENVSLTSSSTSPRTTATSSSSATSMDTERTAHQEEPGRLRSAYATQWNQPTQPWWHPLEATKQPSKQIMQFQMASSSSSQLILLQDGHQPIHLSSARSFKYPGSTHHVIVQLPSSHTAVMAPCIYFSSPSQPSGVDISWAGHFSTTGHRD